MQTQVVSETLTDELDAALIAQGFERGATTAYLAHVGPAPDVAAPPGFEFERVGEPGLAEFTRVRLMGFASSEEAPCAGDQEREIAVRRAELIPANGLAIGRLDRAPASIIAWYGGPHTLIFLLATRVPFRRRGLACALIRRVHVDALAAGGQSVLINADVDDHPIEIYRALGFRDEVYRERRYTLST